MFLMLACRFKLLRFYRLDAKPDGVYFDHSVNKTTLETFCLFNKIRNIYPHSLRKLKALELSEIYPSRVLGDQCAFYMGMGMTYVYQPVSNPRSVFSKHICFAL